jgi:hypothetical protein
MHMPRIRKLETLPFRGMCVFLLASLPLLAQETPRPDETRHAFTAFCNVITSAQIFTDPKAVDPIDRNATSDIGAMLSASVQYGVAVSSIVRLQASFEYVSGSEKSYDNYDTEWSDGFRMYGVELSGIFLLPVSGKRFLLYLGGGCGGYWGSREYSVDGLAAGAPASSLAFGILTVFGLEYRFLPPLSLKAELRFRDPQIETGNAFDRSTLDVRGVTYHLPTQSFPSKVNLNGEVYSIGLCWSL